METREAWLIAAGARTASLVGAVPRVHVSVGFPKGHRGRGRAIGQCWDGSSSTDGAPHIFISPVLSDPVQILAVLVHEQVHAAVGCACGHKGDFVKAAKAAGLVKPWTATTASPDLAAKLEAIARDLGPFPHAALSEPTKEKKGSRLRLFECGCGVKVRVARDEFNATCDDCGDTFNRQ